MSEDIDRAVYHRDLPALRKLVTGQNIDAVDDDGRTLLMHAIAIQDKEIVDFLISNGADVNIADKFSWAALHFAARDQQEVFVNMLLDAGAVPDCHEEYGNTPLGRCLTHKQPNLNIVWRLLAEGADPNKKNNYGVSPIEALRLAGDDELANMLEEYVNN